LDFFRLAALNVRPGTHGPVQRAQLVATPTPRRAGHSPFLAGRRPIRTPVNSGVARRTHTGKRKPGLKPLDRLVLACRWRLATHSRHSWDASARMALNRDSCCECEDACPLCGGNDSSVFHRDSARPYLRCARCALVFVRPKERPDAATEKARYDLHQNDPVDTGYRRFLAFLADAVVRNTPLGSEGLDFGCGPGPALAMMLRQAGRPTALYDPFYAPDETVWSRSYDFISSSETFEHLNNPGRELDRLFKALRPGGLLAIMTQFAPPVRAVRGLELYSRPHACVLLQPDHVRVHRQAMASRSRIRKREHRVASPPS
jgi:hypothetical protein